MNFQNCFDGRVGPITLPTWRSKRPGRKCRTNIWAVCCSDSNNTSLAICQPSILTSNWFNACSRSSWLKAGTVVGDQPHPISSIKMIYGAFFFRLCGKITPSREAPTPTNTSTKSEPEIKEWVLPASPATALVHVFAQVAPANNTPFGILAPIVVNSFDPLSTSTTSSNFAFVSSS